MVTSSRIRRQTLPSRHGDIKSVVATPLESTLRKPPISVDSKPLAETPNPLDATLTKNRGEAVCPLRAHHSLHVRGVHVHGDGSLDQFQRDDHPQIALSPFQDALQSRERSSRYPHMPPRRQEGMWPRAQTLRKPRLQDFYFVIRQGRRQSAKTDQPNNARNLYDAHPVTQREPRKYISGKERQVQCHATVFPPSHGIVKWQKVLDVSRPQLCRDALFMVRACVRRVPTRLRHRLLLLQQNYCAVLWFQHTRRASGYHHGSRHASTSGWPYTASPRHLQGFL